MDKLSEVYSNDPNFVDAEATYCGLVTAAIEDPKYCTRGRGGDIIFDATVRTLDPLHDHKGAEMPYVADCADFWPIVGLPGDASVVPHTSRSGNKHKLTPAFASTFFGEATGIEMLQDVMPNGAKQNTQQRAGGGGTSKAMHACTAGACQMVYAIYFIASHHRRPDEMFLGNVPAPLSRFGTPAGKLMTVQGGERGARAFWRKGLRNVVKELRAFDATT
jgi:hypothetical protein